MFSCFKSQSKKLDLYFASILTIYSESFVKFGGFLCYLSEKTISPLIHNTTREKQTIGLSQLRL